MRIRNDALQRFVRDLRTFLVYRLRNGSPRIGIVERTDEWKIEQPLGIGLRATHLSPQLRKSRTHQHDREPGLCGSVECRNQRCELVLLDILNFVDEQYQRDSGLLGGCADRLQQRLQIVLEVSVVGKAGLGLEIEADFDIAEFHLERFDEPGEPAQRAQG